LAQELGLSNKVNFVGPISQEDLKRIYQEYNILIFPSIWEEPFGITILEAMASKVIVICSATGGSAEIVESGNVALIFPTNDSSKCADNIIMALHDEVLRKALVSNAYEKVKFKFNLKRTFMNIEKHLIESRAC